MNKYINQGGVISTPKLTQEEIQQMAARQAEGAEIVEEPSQTERMVTLERALFALLTNDSNELQTTVRHLWRMKRISRDDVQRLVAAGKLTQEQAAALMEIKQVTE